MLDQSEDPIALCADRDELAQMVNDTRERWGSWERLERIGSTIDQLKPQGLAGESRLEQASKALRQVLLERADTTHQRTFKTPALGRSPALPNGERLKQTYERSSTLNEIEERVAGSAPRRLGWSSTAFVCSSGMAALFHLLWALQSMRARELVIECIADYYETRKLLKAASSLGYQSRGETDPTVLLVEPISYSNTVNSALLDYRLERFANQTASKPRLIIFDITLDPSPDCYARWLTVLESARSPAIVAFVRSALKFDQAGLELLNAGVAEILVPSGLGVGDRLLHAARINRSLIGSSLPFSAQAAATLPFVLTRTHTEEYAKRVLFNNRKMRRSLADGAGNYLQIEEGSTPFVTFSLRESSLEDYMLMVAALRVESRRRGLTLEFGSSFGFRHSRIEGIIPDPDHSVWKEPVIKLAVGARQGPSMQRLRDLLLEFDALGSAKALNLEFKFLEETSREGAKAWKEAEQDRRMPDWIGKDPVL